MSIRLGTDFSSDPPRKRRVRLSYANVTATLALVLAMSGGALAAGRYLITSTSQISPQVLRRLGGRNGKRGATGKQGAQGPTGAQGVAGATGPAGPTGPQGIPGVQGNAGEAGPAGRQGPMGPPGEQGQLPRSLEAGKTETGAWTISAGATNPPVTTISFPIPLAHAMGEADVHYVASTGDGVGCPGTAQQPSAEPGDLCVYQVFTENVILQGGLAKEVRIADPSEASFSGTQGAAVSGALLSLGAEVGAKSVYAYGTWAVTGSK